MTQNAFYLMLKALFVLEIFTLLAKNFWSCKIRLETKVNLNSQFYDVTDWTTISYNAHIPQYFKKQKQPDNEFFSHNRI